MMHDGRASARPQAHYCAGIAVISVPAGDGKSLAAPRTSLWNSQQYRQVCRCPDTSAKEMMCLSVSLYYVKKCKNVFYSCLVAGAHDADSNAMPERRFSEALRRQSGVKGYSVSHAGGKISLYRCAHYKPKMR
jgi:hypothetical protein